MVYCGHTNRGAGISQDSEDSETKEMIDAGDDLDEREVDGSKGAGT